MKITNNTNQAPAAAPAQATQKRGNGAYVTLIPETKRKGNVIGFAKVYYNGVMISDIRIIAVPSKDGQDFETFYGFPNRLRYSGNMDAQGQRIPAYDEAGKPIYDDIAAPCTKESREEIIALIEEELAKKIAGTN